MAGLSTNAPGLWGGFAGLLYGSTSLSTPPGFLADATPAWVPAGGVLAFEFDNGLGYNSRNLATTTPDSILTYTSPSPKLVYGSDGVLRYAPHNLLVQSQTFETAAWVRTNVSVVNTADVVAPDGTLTADKIENTINAPTAGAQLLQTLTTLGSGEYVYSVYAKIGSGDTDSNRFVVRNNTTALNFVTITINWSTGAITQTTGSGATATSAGDGWWRIVMPFSLTATVGDSIRFFVGVSGQVEGVGEFVYAWGAQLQRTPNHSNTYIPTTTAAVYSLPIDHNPTTFEPLGVLIEEERTNLLLQSENCTVTWTNPIGPTTSTKVNIASPFHAGTAFQITSTLNSGFSSGGLRQGISVAATTKHILSFYVEDNVGEISIGLENGLTAYGANFVASINTVTGTASGAQASQVTIAAVNGGWRVSADLGTSKAGGGAAQIEFQMVDLNVPKIIGAPQLEQGAFPTSYIPTVASQVTRLADQVSILTSAFGWNAAAGTIATEYYDSGINSALWRIDDGGDNYYFRAIRDTGSMVASAVYGGVAYPVYLTATAKGMPTKFAAGWDAASINAAINGTLGTANTSLTLPTVLIFRIGNNRNAQYYNSHIKRLTYFPTRRTDADLQVLTRGDDLVWGAGDYLVWGSGNNLTW